MNLDLRIESAKQFLDELLAREHQALRTFVEYELGRGKTYDDYLHRCEEVFPYYHRLVPPDVNGRIHWPADSATAAEKAAWDQHFSLQIPAVFKIMAFDSPLFPELYVAYLSDAIIRDYDTYSTALFITAALPAPRNDRPYQVWARYTPGGDQPADYWRHASGAQMPDAATGPVVAIQRYTPPDRYPSGSNQFQLTDWHQEPADYAATGWNYFAPASP